MNKEQRCLKKRKVRKAQSRLVLTLLIAHCSFLISSCQTPPAIQELSPEVTNVIPLETGGLAYFFVDTKRSEPILKHINIEGLDKKSFQQILDMTNYAAAAVYPKESGKRFRLAARGGYPVSNLNLALGLNKDWKKYRTATRAEYWHSSNMKLSIAFNSGQAFMLSTVDDSATEPFNTQSTEVPDGFVEFIRGSVISGWYERPGEAVSRQLRESGIAMEIPADRLLIGLFQAEGPPGESLYEAHLRIQTPSSIQARMIVSFLTIARNALSPNTSSGDNNSAALLDVLFANPPVVNGSNIDIKTGALNGSVIALLFDLFSL
jgi:hypothetical protein